MGGGGCDRTLNSAVTFSSDLTQASVEIEFRFCSVLPLPGHNVWWRCVLWCAWCITRPCDSL